MTLADKSFLLTYPTGLRLIGRYTCDSVAWEALTGPAAGTTGVERTYTHEVAPGIYFVSWAEESGTTVSQVLDLNAKSVTGFLTFGGEKGRQTLFMQGSLTEVPPAAAGA
ncbi:MAG: MoaF N-terminal domain-containing protein [Vicinamibacterales bacterium]